MQVRGENEFLQEIEAYERETLDNGEIIEDFEDLENDITDTNADEKLDQYENPIQFSTNVNNEINDETNVDNVIFNFDEVYNLAEGQVIKPLEIGLGSSKIPRYQCGDHKLDIVGKKSILLHPPLRTIVSKLNKSNSHIK